jgi:hypothetical protein
MCHAPKLEFGPLEISNLPAEYRQHAIFDLLFMSRWIHCYREKSNSSPINLNLEYCLQVAASPVTSTLDASNI